VSDKQQHVHLVAICGVGMAPLAVLLKKAGYRVTGSDKAAYPPMSDVLRAAGIEIQEGFKAEHLDPRPDLVIVGNAVPRENPEAVRVEDDDLAKMSFPEAVAEFFIADRKSLVVAGTHGKTTTTGMLARVLDDAQERPGYLVGGLVSDLGEFARAADGDYFVIEGDEYDSAYFDKRPKFVHYRPHAAIVTSIEFDHADIYSDMEAIRAAFHGLAGQVPSAGFIVGNGDYVDVLETVKPNTAARFISYGTGADNDWRLADLQSSAVGISFEARFKGSTEARVSLQVPGEMNALNALAVFALCRELGIDDQPVLFGLSQFQGATRRQQKVGEEEGIVVIDDFAHHPTAVAATLEAIRGRYVGHRIVAVFEPRSNTSRRSVFQRQYTEALKLADLAVVSAVYVKEADPLAVTEMLSTDKIVEDLTAAGREAWTADGPDAILARLAGELRSGDVVVCMSNGAFGGLPRRLLAELGGRATTQLTVQP
jgi:UDP-N-acetylmuramate: L-alanyl-gamma-D-glutamyl-meso-diaminopimelate ligase